MFEIYHQWIHHTFSDPVDNYWFPFFIPGLLGIFGLVFLSCWHTDEVRFKGKNTPNKEMWAAGIRGFFVGVVLDLLWPWVAFALIPVTVLVLLVFGGWSFKILIPTKAERIAKREDKARTLRAKVNELRSSR